MFKWHIRLKQLLTITTTMLTIHAQHSLKSKINIKHKL